MVTITKLNNALKSVSNTVSINELGNAFKSSISNFFSLFQSDGKEVGDIVQGFEVIADEGLGTKKETLSPIVGRLSENAGISLKSASSRKGDISTITGQSVVDGFLYSSVSNVNAIGINNTLSSLSNDKTGINKIISSVANGNVSEALLNAVSPEGVAKDAIIQASNIRNKTTDLTTLIKNETGVDLTNVLTGDTNIKNSIESDLNVNIKTSELSNPSIVNSVKGFTGSTTPDNYEFTYVNTVEELLLEFRNSERAFSHILVDYTKEYLDDNYDAKDYHILYSSIEFAGGDDEETLEVIGGKGYDGIPYHYLIRKDGRIQRGRPLDIASPKYGSSIVIGIPGGYDAPHPGDHSMTETPSSHANYYLKVNSGSTTSWYWFNALLDVAYTMFPGIQVYASDELKEIGWDADVYISSLFGKKNNVELSNNDTTLTRSTLTNTRLLL